jgi:hypothetical protein
MQLIKYIIHYDSRGSTVGIATADGLEDQGDGVRGLEIRDRCVEVGLKHGT